VLEEAGCDVIVGATGATTIANDEVVADAKSSSLTVDVIENEPSVVGVPEMVDPDRLNPAGKEPVVVKVFEPYPPEASPDRSSEYKDPLVAESPEVGVVKAKVVGVLVVAETLELKLDAVK
jgi:hypothetical protein